VWERYGQLAKKILSRAVGPHGALCIEHEVPIVDAQSGDAYFVPDPGKDAQRAELGWLGEMMKEPCLLEMLQRAPGPVETRDNLRKQLTLDHAVALEAARGDLPRPPFLRLWQLTTGRPAEVLDGYGMTEVEPWPRGFWFAPRLLAMAVVVLSEVPRQRDTLLLRLLGRGRVLEEAIADLQALPPEALEREVAMAPLVALRFEVKQNPTPDDEERAFLMSTQDLYEQWEKRVTAEGMAKGRAEGMATGRAEGKAEGLVRTLIAMYETRFGPIPVEVSSALAKVAAPEATERWVGLFLTGSADDIAAALRNGHSV
jgi:hypothetical protein